MRDVIVTLVETNTVWVNLDDATLKWAKENYKLHSLLYLSSLSSLIDLMSVITAQTKNPNTPQSKFFFGSISNFELQDYKDKANIMTDKQPLTFQKFFPFTISVKLPQLHTKPGKPYSTGPSGLRLH